MIRALLVLPFTALTVAAQTAFPPAIEDNSFLIEEAYNQDPRVVQHITTAVHVRPSRDWELSFTQEWPLFSRKHQLSYTVPYAWLQAPRAHGVGDIALNYRYQLTGDDAPVTLAPRLSVLLPTGKAGKNLGGGKTGYQFNLPASRRLAAAWAAHANAGVTAVPGVSTGGDRKTLWSANVGGSLVWLCSYHVNLLMEWASSFDDAVDGQGRVRNKASHVINPGLRGAYDIESLQIVPGVAFPLQLNGTPKTHSIFLYFSVEHGF